MPGQLEERVLRTVVSGKEPVDVGFWPLKRTEYYLSVQLFNDPAKKIMAGCLKKKVSKEEYDKTPINDESDKTLYTPNGGKEWYFDKEAAEKKSSR